MTKTGRVKPNRQPAPGSMGNTQGLVLPDTAPNPASHSAPPIQPAPEEKSWWQRWGSDAVHLGLDLIGLIPVVGEVADGANALLYLAEGDTVNAALSAAAMVPGAGMAATGAKLGKKAVGAVAEGAGKTVAKEGAEKVSKEVAEEAGEQGAKKGKPGGKDKGKPKPKPGCGKSGPYKDRKGYNNEGMDWDHVPSKQALLERALRAKGDRLTPAEIAAIGNNAPAIAVPRQLHRDHSQTYGGRQNQKFDGVRRARRDSQELQRAAKENVDALLEHIDKYDPGCKGAYKSAAEKITDMTDEQWEKWLKKTIKDASKGGK